MMVCDEGKSVTCTPMSLMAAVALALATFAAASAAAPPSSANPEQLHLAVAAATATTSGMNVMWYTAAATPTSEVHFGTSPAALTRKATGAARAPYMGSAAYGQHHSVDVLGLTPDALVYYRCGSGGNVSSVRSFRAPPDVAAGAKRSMGFALFGDMGWLGSKERPMLITLDGLKRDWSAVPTRARLEALKGEFEFVWHLGDIGYIDDAFAHHPTEFGYETTYNGFMNWIQNLSSTRPYHVSPGNHESECHSAVCQLDRAKYALKLNNFSAYNHRWRMPSASSKGVQNMWYSFNYGLVHFVSINTETDFPTAEERTEGDSHNKDLPAGHFGAQGEYMAWLEADLKQARSQADLKGGRPWIIAGGHRPIGDCGAGVQALFEKHGVVAYFAGHSHSYSRSAPTFSNGSDTGDLDGATVFDAASAATTFIVAGGAGCDEMTYAKEGKADGQHDCDASGFCLRRNTNQHACVAGAAGCLESVVKSGRLASGVLTVHNTTTLEWKLYSSTDGGVIDSLVMSQA